MLGDQKKVETTNLATVVEGLSLGQGFSTASGLVVPLWNTSVVVAQWGRAWSSRTESSRLGREAFAQQCPEGREGKEIPIRLEFLLLWHSTR